MTQVINYTADNLYLSYLYPFVIDMQKHCNSYVYSYLFLESPPLLLGRCLCLGGRYAKIMPLEVSSRFLEATVNGLQENQPPCIRISAVKAIYWFSEASTEKDSIVNIIRCHMPNIFQGLFSLVSQPNTDILILVMETFQILVWVML